MENTEEDPEKHRGKRGLGARPILESQIIKVQETAMSAADAARMLRVSYNTYKKYAKLYGLFEKVKNPTGIGIKRAKFLRSSIYNIDALINGQHPKYPLVRFKRKLLNSGYVPKICGSCGFSEERLTDGKMPLLLDFIDGDLNNRTLENIRPLCYNCFFLLVGDRNQKKWYDRQGIPEQDVIEQNKQKYAEDLYK